jgi:hypothetical protein
MENYMIMNKRQIEDFKEEVANLVRNRRLLINYIRDKNNNPYGVVVSVLMHTENVVFAHAIWNTRKSPYNRYLCLHIAISRAIKGKCQIYSKSDSYALELDMTYSEMVDRAERYFKREVVVA